MLIEGVMLYLLIIEVYNTELKMRFCYCFSFGESLGGAIFDQQFLFLGGGGGVLEISNLRYRYNAFSVPHC